MKLSIVTLATATGLSLATTAVAQTVPDSSFEAPDVSGSYEYNPTATGVSFNNNAGVAANTFGPGAYDGKQFGFVQSGGGDSGNLPGSIVFAVTGLTTGRTYDVIFYGAQRAGYDVNPLAVSFDGTALGTFSPTSNAAYDFFMTGNFLATNTFGNLSFLGAQTGGDFDSAIDKISVNLVSGATGAVPEPASWAMMIAGLGMVGGAMRRRRRVAGTAIA